jgi:hypothetical protein
MKKETNQKHFSTLNKLEKEIKERLEDRQMDDQQQPVINAKNIAYEASEKTRAMIYGGIGAIHTMVKKIGLDKDLDDNLELLKVHLPYHESDHVLNIAYNVLVGGQRLQDIELRRNDAVFLDALDAQRIPDPTTAGDFTRRFKENDILKLMIAINCARERVWAMFPNFFRDWTYIDVDGMVVGTYGECKEGMDIAYNGIWGYHPLVISIANTKEVLYLVNRPGSDPSHFGSPVWIDRAISLVAKHAKKICLRGDTDFSLTGYFDDWSQRVDFIFGMDARAGLIKLAQALPVTDWVRLERDLKYVVKTEERKRPENVKQKIVRKRGYKNIRLIGEHVAEFEYTPDKCDNPYRMVVVRKTLAIEKGGEVLSHEFRYFFYITTRRDLSAAEVVKLANKRCDQENINEQLKNGVNAMRLPVRDLISNWAYMVMAALAWNLKAWFGLFMPNHSEGLKVIRMEFRRFLNTFILIPCQIIRAGRKIIFRILGYKEGLRDFFATFERIRSLQL